MKKEEEVPGSPATDPGHGVGPVPSRGPLKSVNWAPRFTVPEQVMATPKKKPFLKRTSPRLSAGGTVSTKHVELCKVPRKNSKEKIQPGRKSEVRPIRIVSYHCRRGGKKREALAAGLKEPLKEPVNKRPKAASNAQVCLKEPLTEPISKRPKAASNTQVYKTPRGGLRNYNRANKIDVGSIASQSGREWVSVPLESGVEGEEYACRNHDHVRPQAEKSFVQVSAIKTVKIENDRKVATSISEVWQDSPKLLKRKLQAENGPLTDKELRQSLGKVTRIFNEAEKTIQVIREIQLKRARTEKAKIEAEKQQLQNEIAQLSKKHGVVMAEKLCIERDRDSLKTDFLGKLKLETDKVRDDLQLNLDKKYAEDNAALNKELSNEQEKTCCQICFTAPRDALVLPCMHFQYCNDCLQKHQRRNKECPTCRAKISGVLRCNLSAS